MIKMIRIVTLLVKKNKKNCKNPVENLDFLKAKNKYIKPRIKNVHLSCKLKSNKTIESKVVVLKCVFFL